MAPPPWIPTTMSHGAVSSVSEPRRIAGSATGHDGIMTSPADRAATRADFRALHVPGTPLVMPNAWDAGSAKLFASLGFAAIATTSSGFAATLGRADGGVTRDEALAHTADLAAATALPVNADLEDCFADDPAGVAATITAAVDAGAAGASVEDYAHAGSDLPARRGDRAGGRGGRGRPAPAAWCSRRGPRT